MKKWSATVSCEFQAAHRLNEGCYSEACSKSVHGHSYKASFTLEADELDAQGMVIDCSRMKEALRTVCNEMDHRFIAPQYDIFEQLDELKEKYGKVYILPHLNTTSERIAEHIAENTIAYLDNNGALVGCRIVRMICEVRETENNALRYEREF